MSVVPSWVPSMRPGRVQTQDRFDKTAEEVYAAINDPRAWWDGEFEGSTDQLGAEFIYRYQDMHASAAQDQVRGEL